MHQLAAAGDAGRPLLFEHKGTADREALTAADGRTPHKSTPESETVNKLRQRIQNFMRDIICPAVWVLCEIFRFWGL
jgi:hypothetical protein